jgi:hypothetical protein
MMVDRSTEIATLRQKLAAAEARIQERGRPRGDKENALKLLASWKSDKTKNTSTIDTLRDRQVGDTTREPRLFGR